MTVSFTSPKGLEPLVSVVMPVYQGEKFILNAVRSVLHQTYAHLELIVVDDGSTDQTLQQLAQITDPRLKILQQVNQGTAAARNLAIAQAQGEYIAFLDADDLWFPSKLAAELNTLAQCPDPVCIIYSWYYAVDQKNRLVNFSPPYRQAGMIFETVLQHESVLLPSTTLLHKDILNALGGFAVNCYHEDRLFFIHACKRFPAYPTGQRLVVYQQTTDGKCRRILSHYEEALHAELSIVEGLKTALPLEEIKMLEAIQRRNLFYRLLMYNFMASARFLYPAVNPRLITGKKGMLARMSMTAGVNFLYYCRILIQSITKYGFFPWWHWKTRPLRSLLG